MLALVYFTFKDLVHDRWRSLLTLLSLVVVAAAYLLLASLSRAFLVVGSQPQVTHNLVILSADAIDPMESSLDEEILQTARGVAPDLIQRAFPTLFRHLDIQGRVIQVRAVPLEEMPEALGLTLVQGGWPSGARQVVVGEEIAQVTAWRIGSIVNIYGTGFQVTGLVRSAENNLGAIWMTYSEGLNLFGMRHGFQVGYLPLAPMADPESVRARLQADPRINPRYSIYLENAVSAGYNQVNHNLVTLSGIMAVISLLAITFWIYNSISLSLTERCHEIALLRILGFTQARLRGFLLARVLVITLAAYGLGWTGLFFYIRYLNANAILGFSEAPLTLSLDLATSLLGLILANVFAFIGVWLTSRQIAALNPLTGSD